jgi:4'-phosphopantetheinyl transferase
MPDIVRCAPTACSLCAGAVHIWQFPLPSTTSALNTLPSLLSPAERDRAAHFVFEKDQARFIACRATLRQLLGRYTGTPPEAILFDYAPHGKPSLAGDPSWQFNVSHSRDLAVIAITRDHPLGIDLELIDPEFPISEVAPTILTPGEQLALAALPTTTQPAHFFQLWTLKESLVKALGAGLSLDPREIHLRLPSEILSAPPSLRQATIVPLTSLTLHPGYAAALAILAPLPTISLFTL